MAYETTGIATYIQYVDEGISEGLAPVVLSPSGNGYGYNGGGGGSDGGGSNDDVMAGVSVSGGVATAHNSNTHNATGGTLARHDPQAGNTQTGASEYLLADGHVKFIKMPVCVQRRWPNRQRQLVQQLPELCRRRNCIATFNPAN